MSRHSSRNTNSSLKCNSKSRVQMPHVEIKSHIRLIKARTKLHNNQSNPKPQLFRSTQPRHNNLNHDRWLSSFLKSSTNRMCNLAKSCSSPVISTNPLPLNSPPPIPPPLFPKTSPPPALIPPPLFLPVKNEETINGP